MDTALTQKFPFVLDRNLAKANCTGNRVCTSCDKVVLECNVIIPVTVRTVHKKKHILCTKFMLKFNQTQNNLHTNLR